MNRRDLSLPALAGGIFAFFSLSAACGSSAGDESGPVAQGGSAVTPAPGGSTSTGGTAGAPPSTSGGLGSAGSTPALGGQPGATGGVSATSGAPGTTGGEISVGGAGAIGGGGGGAVSKTPSILGDVTFSVPSQSFKGELMVSLATTIAGAEIRYTIDGSVPSASSSAYTGPLAITATTQLRAQAFVGGAASGTLSTALYIARTFDLSSDLPIILVDGYGKGKPSDKSVSVDAAVMIFEPLNGTASVASPPSLAARAGYHVRGQSSASFPQTPYKVELWDNANQDADYSVLGMPADSDWALIPPYYDRTMIRNPFVYTLGEEIGLDAPNNRYAEVYINYEGRPVADSDYQGIYWVSETIKNNKDRTNLKQLKPDDTLLPQISGGYIFKFDQLAAEEPKIACTGSDPISAGFGMGRPGRGMGGMAGSSGTGTCWTDLEVVDPEPSNAEQLAWLTQYVQSFHDSLHAMPIGDYGQYIDVPSFVDYLIINELTRNVDAYVRSAYYHKDRDGKLKAGPLWDYNFSLAVGGANTVDPTSGFQYSGSRNINNWYPKLTSDPAFMSLVKARWKELRQGLLADAALNERVTQLAAPLANAVARDFAKWPVDAVYGSQSFVVGPLAQSWDQQLQALRDYLVARSAWLDMQYQ